MMARLLKRLGRFLLFCWAVATLTFLVARAVPGDPVLAILGTNPNPEDILRLRRSLELDQPLAVQYSRFMLRLAILDLGESLVDRRPVSTSLQRHLPHTILLALAAMALTVPLSLLLGFLSVFAKKRIWEALATAFSALGLAVPVFLLGLLLVLVFSLGLGLLPVSGSGGIEFLVLPAVTLTFPLGAFLTRVVRAVLHEESQRPYVLLARSKGLSEARIFRRHILKNALIPILTISGMQAGSLLGGAVIVENVFSWPGIGTLLVTAIRQRDLPTIEGTVLLIAAMYYLVNHLVDISYARLDPRIPRDRTG